MDGGAPFHAHIYYSDGDRASAASLRDRFAAGNPPVVFVGKMVDRSVGPHPIPQFEVHFAEGSRPDVIAAIHASGLRALIHPLPDDDLADHTTLAHWIGDPAALDVTTLDPPGQNQGIARFGRSDF